MFQFFLILTALSGCNKTAEGFGAAKMDSGRSEESETVPDTEDDDADGDGEASDVPGGSSDHADDTDQDADDGGAVDETETSDSPEGFIGSPCESDSDCTFEDGICLTDGFPNGHCSVECDRYCPDADGHPVTFCVDGSTISDAGLSGGWCVSRCSFGHYALEGCRDDYGCVVEPRFGEPGSETYACLPGGVTDLSDCQYELAARGVGFEPTIRAVDFPDGRPDKECEIVDPVWVDTPVLGVDLRYVESEAPARLLAGCEMAHALAHTVEDVAVHGVQTLLHIGSYNCRMISGTDSLSEHGFANALDIYGFEFDDGRVWTLIDDWEHDTVSPTTEAGQFLYESSRRWYDDWIWNIILTPNYNLAHDNHFHVDLKPDYHDISFTGARYYGPAPYSD